MISIYTNYKHNQQRALNMFSCLAMHSDNCTRKHNRITEISREKYFIEIN